MGTTGAKRERAVGILEAKGPARGTSAGGVPAGRASGIDSAAPFVKWAGGKRTLVPQLLRLVPSHIDTYYEPFLGGGALFFALAGRIERAILSDTNEELILTYLAVQNHVEELIQKLKAHAAKHHDPDYYYSVREKQPRSELGSAARLIYLNRTCYNGLYRVNRKGKFNVPRGSYTNPTICDASRLRQASEALRKAKIELGSFEKRVVPRRGDFIYCDPPYDGTFTDYQAGGFQAEDQRLLRDCARDWQAKGAEVMLSNANTPRIRRLYQGKDFVLRETQALRSISARANGRGMETELIIRSS